MNNIETGAITVLYEDAFLAIVLKPAGMPVQPDVTGDKSLLEFVADHYQNPTVGLVHRLDRPVSGAVIFTRDQDTLVAMNTLFRDRKVDKVYWAIVEGKCEKPLRLQHTILHATHINKAKETSDKDPQGALAILEVDPLNVGDRYTLLEVRPEGGAFHQIRAQLALAGHPIKGDVKYGARRGEKDRSIMLHARSLSFYHPMTEVPIFVKAPALDGTLWKALCIFPY